MSEKCPVCKLDVIGSERVFTLHVIHCAEKNIIKVELREKNLEDLLLFYEKADEEIIKLAYMCLECFWFSLGVNIPKTCSCGGSIVKASDFVECIETSKDDTPTGYY